MRSFEKYHGLGNDFIIIERAHESEIDREESIRLCDRHFGVGADGILYVIPVQMGPQQNCFKMVVINSDGSRPEMCGNGLRCVALYLVHQKKEKEGEFVVDTDAGLRTCRVVLEADHKATITTSLGIARSVGSLSNEYEGQSQNFIQVSMGNPHAICFQKRISGEALDQLGSRVSARIPGGSNVEIAEVVGPNRIVVDVWERGVGRTLACGTGAAATAFAALSEGLADRKEALEVTLPGGTLRVTVGPDDEVALTGPAQHVYTAQLP